ncbi:hypothetical protein WN943_028669 [Citrus x changshan-huyou]
MRSPSYFLLPKVRKLPVVLSLIVRIFSSLVAAKGGGHGGCRGRRAGGQSRGGTSRNHNHTSTAASKLSLCWITHAALVLLHLAAKGDDSGRLGGSRRCGGHAKNHSSTSARPLLSSITSFLFYAALVLHYAMEHYACMNI